VQNDPAFNAWIAALEARHLRDLEFREVSKALRALSSTYVERRHRVAAGAALSGAGKRAAFALFYAPLHYLLVQRIVQESSGSSVAPKSLLVDLGCGTGAAGAAWASMAARPPRLLGIDRHPWAVQEAAWTYRQFGLSAKTIAGDVTDVHVPRGPASFVAAFTLNELPDGERRLLLKTLLDRTANGDSLLIVEPIAKGAAPWWSEAQAVVERAGGRAEEWRIPVALPPIVQKLDAAAGLRHQVLTARSLLVR
jgi:hypothetical protein